MSQSPFVTTVRQHFDAVADCVLQSLLPREAATLNLNAEETLFVRFNNNRVRQNTNVEQIAMGLQLQGAGRTAAMSRTLSGNVEADCAAMLQMLTQCREELAVLPPDPHQVSCRKPWQQRRNLQWPIACTRCSGRRRGRPCAGLRHGRAVCGGLHRARQPQLQGPAPLVCHANLLHGLFALQRFPVPSKAATPAPTGSPRSGPPTWRTASTFWH